MKIHLLAATLLGSSCTYAQESRSETQAIRCAAVSYLHTNIATPLAFNEAMGNSAQFYGHVFVAFRQVRTGAVPSNGEVYDRRDLTVAEFKKTYEVNPELVVREAALCNTWRAEYAPRIEADQNPQGWSELVKVAGIPPEAPSPKEVEKWRPFVQSAFVAWAKAGYPTRASLIKQIEESIGKKQ
jgi:hypothetical protein